MIFIKSPTVSFYFIYSFKNEINFNNPLQGLIYFSIFHIFAERNRRIKSDRA